MDSSLLNIQIPKRNGHTPHHNVLSKIAQLGISRHRCSELTAALAHEVRNPLTNINLSLEMLFPGIRDSEQKVYLDIIKRSTRRISGLIDDLLKAQEVYEIKGERHYLADLIDEALEMAADRISLKKISVFKNYHQQENKIPLDKVKIKIGLTNIIINAIEAMTAGTGKLTISTNSVNGKYRMCIEDNGCGISPEGLKNIFKPFFTDKPGGLGIGLATTYEFFKSSQVDIDVSSQLGKGTCFNLLFNTN